MEDTNSSPRIFEVEAPLNESISHFYHLRTTNIAEPLWKHLSPNFEMLLVFNFGKPIRFYFNKDFLNEQDITRTAVLGPLRKMLRYELLPGTDAIVVSFTLNGFYRLFRVPLSDIKNTGILDPDVLIDKSCFSNLWEELAALPDITQRIELLKHYSSLFMQENEPGVKPLINGIPYFYNAAIQPVKAISADNNVTERTIQLNFKKYVGYSPKELLRFLRFKAVLYTLLQNSDKMVDVADLIEAFNYHDQSHLIKDFNQYLGTTPQQFFKEIKTNSFCVSYGGKYY